MEIKSTPRVGAEIPAIISKGAPAGSEIAARPLEMQSVGSLPAGTMLQAPLPQTSARSIASIAQVTQAHPKTDADPMTHIRYLASDELQGRDSPSSGLDKASEYIAGLCAAYGLSAPNASDSTGPYFQTFNLYGYGTRPKGTGPAPNESKFGPRIFEHGFYLDETTTKEDLDIIRSRWKERNPDSKVPPLPRLGGKGPVRARTLAEIERSFPLEGSVRNVMGLLKGTGSHKDQVVVVMGHYDHLGVDDTGIYRGADDNGSGSGVMMSMLPQLTEAQKAGKLDRSVLFLWTAGEEKGLVGAEYFVKHPIAGIAAKNIAGAINLDMVGRFDAGRVSYMDTTNGEKNFFHALHEQANRALPTPIEHENHDIDEYVDRQDGWAFSHAGKDVLMIFEGLTNAEGGGDLITEYHTTRDTVDLIERDNGGDKPRRIRDLLAGIVLRASNLQK